MGRNVPAMDPEHACHSCGDAVSPTILCALARQASGFPPWFCASGAETSSGPGLGPASEGMANYASWRASPLVRANPN